MKLCLLALAALMITNVNADTPLFNAAKACQMTNCAHIGDKGGSGSGSASGMRVRKTSHAAELFTCLAAKCETEMEAFCESDEAAGRVRKDGHMAEHKAICALGEEEGDDSAMTVAASAAAA